MHELRANRYEVTRLSVPLQGTFEEAVALYESLVPPLDTKAIQSLVHARAPWEDVLRQAEGNAPHGFMIFWKNAGSALMSLAGDDIPFNMYLMGNHTIAQRMLHYDATVMLHAPLRTEICQVTDGPRLVIDKPSSHFDSYGCREIAQIGAELDEKVAHLIELMNAPVPVDLR